jgi:hypothetical protein
VFYWPAGVVANPRDPAEPGFYLHVRYCALAGRTRPSFLVVKWERGVVPEYRAYLIGLNGHFIKVIQFDCRDDISAAVEAQHLVNGHVVELWSLDSRIARFDPKPGTLQ